MSVCGQCKRSLDNKNPDEIIHECDCYSKTLCEDCTVIVDDNILCVNCANQTEYTNLSNRKLLDLYYSKSSSLRGIINAYIENDKAEKAPNTKELKIEIAKIQDELERRVRKEGLSNIQFDEKYRWEE